MEARTNEEVYQVRFLLGQGLLAMIKCSIHQLGHDLLAMIKRKHATAGSRPFGYDQVHLKPFLKAEKERHAHVGFTSGIG